MKWMEEQLQRTIDASLERHLIESDSVRQGSSWIVQDGRTLLNMSSNDYLGLSQHPDLIRVMQDTLLHEGVGSGASRLVTGNRSVYRQLETEIAGWQQSEAAIVMANGYMANTGVIRSLVGRGDVVFSDRLNHASIVDGIVLSRAEHARYRHGDMEHLQFLLRKFGDRRRKLIVTDTIFSMDGDQAPLYDLVKLKHEHHTMLMVDEAHSGGIYGDEGKGLCHALGIHHEVDIHVGTFSKAFGIYGAYVTGSDILKRWLINSARPLMYSTALPSAIISGISKSLDLVRYEQWRRDALLASSKTFRYRLADAGFRIVEGDSPIIPVLVGDNDMCLGFSAALKEKGIVAVAIRPPTVAQGSSRIRLSLTAGHSDQELDSAVEHLVQTGRQMGVLV